MTDSSAEYVLEVEDLEVGFAGPEGVTPAVRGVSFRLRRGEVFGIVGESGSGKSVTSLAVMGLLPDSARVSGSVRVDGEELLGASDQRMSAIRGERIAMVFQDPLSAFTPVYRIGEQIAEAVRTHRGVDRAAARERAIELLRLVGIPDPERRVDAFPHEFSGGMRQRAMIAMAIANDPDVILADEPTTALDVTIQAQILEVLRTAQRETGAALVFVSHDLGVIAGFADRIAVMYAGRVVETGEVGEIFARPRMPYTLGLIGAVPRIDRGRDRPLVPIPGSPPAMRALGAGCPFLARCPLAEPECGRAEPALRAVPDAADGHLVACRRVEEVHRRAPEPEDIFALPPTLEPARDPGPREARERVLRVEGLVKTFPLFRGSVYRRRTGTVYAVDGVDLDVRAGETLGLVGESGSGKSTALHQILTLEAPEAGLLEVLGVDLAGVSGRRGPRGPRGPRGDQRALRRQISMVFQDPMASLDPRMPIHDILTEPLRAHGWGRQAAAERVPELLALVGLAARDAPRYPHEFSGGQRQRISIARALAAEPRLIVLDEPVSALDVSIQAGVLNLLAELRARLGLAYLFVSHDLSVVRHIADRVSVMYLGRSVETGPVAEVFENPRHPYTRALLAAVPIPDPVRERARERILLPGDPPAPSERHEGCRFRSRCAVAAALPEADRERCRTEEPAARALPGAAPDHTAACHFPGPRPVRPTGRRAPAA